MIEPIDFKPVRVLYDEGAEGGAEEGGGSEGGGSGAAEGGGSGAAEGGQQQEVTLPEGAIFADARFREALPDDLKQHPSLQKMTNVEHMARSYVSAQKMVGKDPDSIVELPKADDPDGRRAVLAKLGLPEKPDGYEKLSLPEGAPEFMKPEGQLAQGFMETAHKLGVLPDQVSGMYQWFSGVMGEAAQAQEAEKNAKADENIRALQGEWGNAYDQRVAAANFAIDKLGGEDLRAALDDAGLGASPVVLKALAQVGGLMAEDGVGDSRGGKGGPFGGAMTPDEARSKARDMQQAALNEKNPSERRRLNEEAQKYYKMATAGK